MAEVVLAAFGGGSAAFGDSPAAGGDGWTGERSEQVRVVLADGQALVREGLVLLLSSQPDLTVMAAVDDGEAAVDACHALGADVVVLEVHPVRDGSRGPTPEALHRLVGIAGPCRPRVIALSGDDDPALVWSVLRAGAAGLVLKQSASTELLLAIRSVAAGRGWLDPAVTGQLIAEFAARPEVPRHRPAPLASLTARETEVLLLVAEGLTNRETARQLFVSEGTVRTHLTRILAKLHLHSRAEAVAAAYRSGLMNVPQ